MGLCVCRSLGRGVAPDPAQLRVISMIIPRWETYGKLKQEAGM